MGTQHKHGFTIIEVVLFLGVSGLMVFGILAGTGTAINQQRYRDSVTTLMSHLQGQYNEVANVNNARTGEWNCNSSTAAIRTDAPEEGGAARGATDCAVAGKYIQFSGEEVIAQTVIAKNVRFDDKILSDVEALKQSNLIISTIDQTTYAPEWDTRLVQSATDDSPVQMYMLIVRSPLTGSIRTFISFEAPGQLSSSLVDIESLITEENLRRGASFCLSPEGFTLGARSQISIEANNAVASGITMKGCEA